jgi:hypothetical protein
MTRFNSLATGGVFGGGSVAPLAQLCSMEIQLLHSDGTPWAKGLVRARINRNCRVALAYPATTYTHYISSAEETVLELDESGMGSLYLFRQALLHPTDGSAAVAFTGPSAPSPTTAFNPHYVVTLPDGNSIFVLPPDLPSAQLDDYIWSPTVFVPEVS